MTREAATMTSGANPGIESVLPDSQRTERIGQESGDVPAVRTRAESMALFGAKTGAALILFLVNVYLARRMGAVEFGKYSLTVAFVNFFSLFFDFGYFASGARLLALGEGVDESRRYTAAMFVIGGVTSLLFVVLILALGPVADRLFPDKIGVILSAIALVSPARVLPFVVEQVLKASRRMYLFAAWTLANALFFGVGLALVGALGRIDAVSACLSYMVAGLGAAGLVIIAVRPKMTGIALYLRRIQAEQRSFGRALYIGRTANVASYRTDNLLLGYFRGAAEVGQYSLAMSFASVITLFSQSLAAAEFRSFTRLRPVSNRTWTWNLSGIALIATLVLVGGHLVTRVYLGPAYSSVGLLLFPAVAASGFQAAYQPYNSWLLANGFGVELRSFLIIVGMVNLLANATLIPIGGAFGAAFASAVGMATYLVLTLRTCRRKGVSAS